MDPTVAPLPSRQARGPVRLVGVLIGRLMIAALAALGLVVPAASAHANIGTVVAVATTADDAHHAGSVDATAVSVASRTARQRRSPRLLDVLGRLVRTISSLAVTSWTMPARIVGGVPPGRAPPVFAVPVPGRMTIAA